MKNLLQHLEEPISLAERNLEIAPILAKILEVYQPFSVYLFGSAARNELKSASDFDFLIILKTEKEVKNAWRKAKEVRPASTRPLDLIFKSEEDFHRGFLGGASMIAVESGQLIFKQNSIHHHSF